MKCRVCPYDQENPSKGCPPEVCKLDDIDRERETAKSEPPKQREQKYKRVGLDWI